MDIIYKGAIMDISKLTEEQLKAMAFDLIRQKEAIQNDLSLVLQQLEKVQTRPTEAKEEKKK